MPKVRFIRVDPQDDSCYEFQNDNDVFVLYTDGRYGRTEGVDPGFWERFAGANVFDFDYRKKDGKNLIVKVNFIK